MPGIEGAIVAPAAPWPAAGGAVGVTGGVAGAGCMLIGRPTGIRGTTTLGISGRSEASPPDMSMVLAVA
jgi:hypothetical protein